MRSRPIRPTRRPSPGTRPRSEPYAFALLLVLVSLLDRAPRLRAPPTATARVFPDGLPAKPNLQTGFRPTRAGRHPTASSRWVGLRGVSRLPVADRRPGGD